MLASGAHVKIGDYEFLLDESMQNHYVHVIEGLLLPRPEVVGAPQGKAQLKEDLLLWALDDWGGGEGNRIYYPEDPLVYDYSEGLNGRIRGQLTGRPKRYVASLAYDDQRDRPVMAVADGALWLAGSRSLYYTVNGSSWTSKASNLSSPARITAAAGEHDYLYYSAYDSTGPGTRYLKRINKSGSATDVVSSSSSTAPYAGLAMMGGRLYGWTGRKLIEHDIFETLPLTSDYRRKVYDTGIDPVNTNVFGTQWWADCIAAENAVIFWYSNDAQSRVYMYRDGVGFPLWNAPYGFTIKSSAYQNGVVFFAGHWGGDENAQGRGAMYALPLATRTAVFIGWFRKHQNLNLQMQEMANSYGSQILVAAARTGRIFVYDMEMDAISLLDDLDTDSQITFTDNDHKIGQLATYGTRRFAAIYRPGASGAGTSIQVVSYEDDEPANRQDNWGAYLYSGSWDYNYPFAQKILLGFHVTFEPLAANQRITIGYSLDGGSWTDLPAITNTTDGASQGRVYLQVSDTTDTKLFYSMKMRIKLESTANGVLTPILYAVTAQAKPFQQDELWSLALRVKDEQPGTRPSYRAARGNQIRDWLVGVSRTGEVVTFLDGYRSKLPGDYDSYEVTIERISDTIARPGEGVMFVTLRRVPR
jgi:hypothetical protein